LDRETKAVALTISFALVSLLAAWVLFTVLQSFAELKGTAYSLGGGIAGFAVVFLLLLYSYGKMLGQDTGKPIGEVAQAMRKLRGYKLYKNKEVGITFQYPAEWKTQTGLTLQIPKIFVGEKVNLNIASNEWREIANVSPELLLDQAIKGRQSIESNLSVINKSTTVVAGCEGGYIEWDATYQGAYQIQYFIMDKEGRRIFWFTFTGESDWGQDQLRQLAIRVMSTVRLSPIE